MGGQKQSSWWDGISFCFFAIGSGSKIAVPAMIIPEIYGWTLIAAGFVGLLISALLRLRARFANTTTAPIRLAGDFKPVGCAVHHIATNTRWGRKEGRDYRGAWHAYRVIEGPATIHLVENGLVKKMVAALGAPLDGGPRSVIPKRIWK